jgi:hypothetical protein
MSDMLNRFSLLLIVLLASQAALAQHVYRWVDDRGEVHYGHAVPPEHAHRGYDRLGRDGTVRESVAPALTPEERAARAARLALEAEVEAEQRSQETRDRMLLAAYRSADDIEAAMTMQLAALDAQRGQINAALAEEVRRFENQIARAAQQSRDGFEVPEQLTQSINVSRAETQRLRNRLIELDQEEEVIRQRFEAEAERFRELTSYRQR